MRPQLILSCSPSTDAASRSVGTASMKTEGSFAGPGTSAEKRTSTFRCVVPHVWNSEPCLHRRSRPYDVSPKTAVRDLPPRSRTPVFHQPQASSSEPTTAAQIFSSMIPAIMQDPAAFQESIPTVCAEHNIDPPVLESLVQNLKSAQLASEGSKVS